VRKKIRSDLNITFRCEVSTIDDLYTRIGERIRQAREDRGWTQAQLGEALGYSQATIGNYELGRRHIGLDDLYRIADALNKPYAFFVGVDRQIEEETRRELEQKVRRDVADFVGVRMLPVISQPVSYDAPLEEGQTQAKMPVPRELAPEADLVYQVPVGSGEFLFLSRAGRPSPGQLWVLQAGGQVDVYRVGPAGGFEALTDRSSPVQPFVIIGRFCGAHVVSPWPPGEGGPAPVAATPWDDLDPADQQQVLQFVEFLRAKKTR